MQNHSHGSDSLGWSLALFSQKSKILIEQNPLLGSLVSRKCLQQAVFFFKLGPSVSTFIFVRYLYASLAS